MDAPKTRTLREDINAALAAVAEKHGLHIHAGNCTYNPTSCMFKLECAERAEDGRILDKSAQMFLLYAADYGLKPEWLGRKFKNGPNTYQLTGLNPRKGRPVLATKDGNDAGAFAFAATPGLIALIEKGA